MRGGYEKPLHILGYFGSFVWNKCYPLIALGLSYYLKDYRLTVVNLVAYKVLIRQK
jgi:hypothetical protein